LIVNKLIPDLLVNTTNDERKEISVLGSWCSILDLIPWGREFNITELAQICDNLIFLNCAKLRLSELFFFLVVIKMKFLE
jgi:hypothetical protein